MIGQSVKTFLLLALAIPGAALADLEPAIELTLEPRLATVGDPLELTLTVTLPEDTAFEPPGFGPQIGPFTVSGGSWMGPEEIEGGNRWRWLGQLSAFETGELELPAISVRLQGADVPGTIATEPQTVTIESVLNAAELEEGDVPIADLKPPVSIDPDYGPLWTALVILGLLTGAALLAWWMHRRYGARLAAAAVPEDPFNRIPPHVWVYSELQRLLERRLPEQDQVELFYSELARILKMYLGGRFRVDLMERTTDEVPPSLRQAGAPEPPIEEAKKLLLDCDRVKFAREEPGPAEWKSGVEEVYRIVDRTKPAEVAPKPAQPGAA